MILFLQILLALVAVICLLVSIKLLKNGHKLFPATEKLHKTGLDNLLRFMGGLILGFAILCAWTALTITAQSSLVYLIGICLLLAAFGRLLSRQTVGIPPQPREFFMWAEFVLGIALIALQYLRINGQ
jgi:Domain of unknown function (DUF4345)